MLTPEYADVLTWFYPVGNTPAVCLTQGVPPDRPADILLLGCGDLRNILFTAHVDARPLDITCCDCEKAILARNVLLLSMLIDDSDATGDDNHWRIYYHLYLDQLLLDLLRNQAKKLKELSSSLVAWNKSKYAKWIRFCDSISLAQISELWEFYSVQRIGDALASFEAAFKSTIATSAKRKDGWGTILTGLRSAAPTCVDALTDLGDLHKQFWEHGMPDEDWVSGKYVRVNPMFTSPDNTVVLHYGTDPLLGFHLATAYVPLQSGESLSGMQSGSNLSKVVKAARAEFNAWSDSFRRRPVGSLTLRLFSGDAIALSHVLHHHLVCGGGEPAHWYRDRYQFLPLALDDDGYGPEGTAPLSFTVVDTSNLLDHVGSMNLLVATSPLLRDYPSASLYTEMLVRREKSIMDLVDNMLCGPLSTVAPLLGLVAVEYCTNTSGSSPSDELLLDLAQEHGRGEQAGQQFVRLTWKRPPRWCSAQPSPASPRLCISEDDLAQVLFRVYLGMFEGEQILRMLENVDLLKLRKLSFPHYHRASYASFLYLIRDKVAVDWKRSMALLLGLIEKDTTVFTRMNYIQELYMYMHLFEVYSVEALQRPMSIASRMLHGDLRDWTDAPQAVCITLRVPRDRLEVVTKGDPSDIGTPPIQGVVQSSGPRLRAWQNTFAAIQVGFGNLSTTGATYSNDFKVQITDDTMRWCGSSPLLASFMVPTWMLLLEPQAALVSLCIQSTPANAAKFLQRLGLDLKIYETNLSDRNHVFISRNMPNHHGPMHMCPLHKVSGASSTKSDVVHTSVTAHIDTNDNIRSLTGRLDIRSDELRSALRNGCLVQTNYLSPFNFEILIGSEKSLTLDFPIPVGRDACRTRIARKSSYIEVVVPTVSDKAWTVAPSATYPVFLDGRMPVCWNLPYVRLHASPLLDISQRERLRWLNMHAGSMFCARERRLRSDQTWPSGAAERTRLHFKDSLLSLLMHFTGLQGRQDRIFGINNPTGGGIHIVVFVSQLRLDLSARAIFLDAAVLPLYDKIMPDVMELLQALMNRGFCNIKVDDAELVLWRHVLPVWVERCRTWAHQDGCRYCKENRIPVSTRKGEELLCRCGYGMLPEGYMTGVPKWEIAAKHSVRIAISPLFWSPLVEDGYDRETLGGCRVCRRTQTEDGSALLLCSRCHKAKYCSTQCQRADWNAHKRGCSSSHS